MIELFKEMLLAILMLIIKTLQSIFKILLFSLKFKYLKSTKRISNWKGMENLICIKLKMFLLKIKMIKRKVHLLYKVAKISLIFQ